MTPVAETSLRNHPDLAGTAFHESGHAVAALRNGLVLRTVDVVYTIDRFGAADYDHQDAPRETRALCLLAGGAAERRYTGSVRAMDTGDVDDLRVLFRDSDLDPDRPYAECPLGAAAERQRIVNEWYAKAEAFVEREWMWIERVAQALQRRERLTGAEVKTLCSHPVVRADPPPTVDERTLVTTIADTARFDSAAYEAAQQRLTSAPIELTDADFEQLGIVSSDLESQAIEARRLAQIAKLRSHETAAVQTKALPAAPAVPSRIRAYFEKPTSGTETIDEHCKRAPMAATPLIYLGKLLAFVSDMDDKNKQRNARLGALEQEIGPLKADLTTVKTQLAETRSELAAVRAEPRMKYLGIWRGGKTHEPGDVLTHKNSLWVCAVETSGTPGDDFVGWRMVGR